MNHLGHIQNHSRQTDHVIRAIDLVCGFDKWISYIYYPKDSISVQYLLTIDAFKHVTCSNTYVLSMNLHPARHFTNTTQCLVDVAVKKLFVLLRPATPVGWVEVPTYIAWNPNTEMTSTGPIWCPTSLVRPTQSISILQPVNETICVSVGVLVIKWGVVRGIVGALTSKVNGLVFFLVF